MMNVSNNDDHKNVEETSIRKEIINGSNGGGYVCVALLCGIPGSGKSTAARSIIKYFNDHDDGAKKGKEQPSITTKMKKKLSFDQVILIDYDSIANNQVFLSKQQQQQQQEQQTVDENKKEIDDESPIELKAWRHTRVLALERLTKILNDYCNNNDKNNNNNRRVLIIMDDNFFLRSMRRDVFQVCQRQVQQQKQKPSSNASAIIGLAIFYFDTPISICLERNSKRTNNNRIPDNVIHRMAQRLEPPNPLHSQSYWESSFVTIVPSSASSSSQDNDDELLNHKVETCVYHSLVSNPVKEIIMPQRKSVEQLQMERMNTIQCRMHRSDLLLRTLVRTFCQTNSKQYASIVNSIRKQILSLLKQKTPNTSSPNEGTTTILLNDNNNNNTDILHNDDAFILQQFQNRLNNNIQQVNNKNENNYQKEEVQAQPLQNDHQTITKILIEQAYQTFLHEHNN